MSVDVEPARSGDESRPRAVIGESLSNRHNSLNFLRLFLAGLVIIDHAAGLGGFGSLSFNGKTTIGVLGVYGFFGISGYLIAASASRNKLGRFVWMRVLRIYPAFIVCLVLTASLFGLIGWYHSNNPCGLSCYLRVHNGPIQYILHNIWLRKNQASITGTLKGAPFALEWNGSLWSLFYEFLCYLLLALLAFTGLLRKGVVLGLAAVILVEEIIVTSVPGLNVRFNSFIHVDVYKLLQVVPIFLVGTLIYLYRDKIPDSGFLALGCLAVFSIGLVLPLGINNSFRLTSADFMAPALAYPMLWLGIHLPFAKIGARNDYSYGLYIYGWPVTQVLALWGVYRLGFAAWLALIVVGTGTFAVGSWWLIERRALQLKNISFRTGKSRSTRNHVDGTSDLIPTTSAVD